ncbi:calcium-binding protein [Microvirga brassicacearum]|uniref:calcium-binding protein n=1 Tax=Microvirga brassicacearum TaxID=2580413 RepID=UPI00139112C9|nr:calcium-binding protein [Microvirga brassicacearum]
MVDYNPFTNIYTLEPGELDLTIPEIPNNPNASAIGNELNNTITGNSGNNSILGGDGLDTLNGGDGADSLIGGAGKDVLDGGVGADTLEGGGGSDLYHVDDSGDLIIEAEGEGADTVFASISLDLSLVAFSNVEDAMLTGPGNLDLTGNGLANILVGNSDNNFIFGGLGDDVLDGGGGLDELAGGQGNDTYYINDASTVVTENANEGADTIFSTIDIDLNLTEYAHIEQVILFDEDDHNLTGNNDANALYGNTGVNSIVGGAGNDTLKGCGGADTLEGGQGDDIYLVDDTDGTLTELVGEGIDLVVASISYTLGDGEFERLELADHGNIDGTGNDLDNQIIGNDGSNRLNGGVGADTLAGSLGNDTYVIDDADIIEEFALEGTDTIEITAAYAANAYTLGAFLESVTVTGTRDFNATGNTGDNLIVGNSGRNTLTGDAGSDTLIGGGGDDIMVGGTGDDLYIVDSTSDMVTELAGGGSFDRVITRANYTLAANLEYLAMENGAGNISGTGNALDNTMFGNDGNNVIDGGAGRDQLNGATGNDIVYGGDGDDTINESGDGSDVLNGGTGNDDLRAEGGNDVLDGGTGADQLKGGSGNDVYVVDNAFDVVLESAGEGTDSVTASASFNLTAGASVEKLVANAGGASINLGGNEAINAIIGNAGRNKLAGMDGNDLLTGGKGKDIFVFETKLNKKTNLDKITDFSVKDDSIQLDNAIFKKIGKGTPLKPGKLNKAFFALDKPKDKNDYVIYNKKKGVLSYDADGSGTAKATDFAVLKKGLSLTAADFFVI